RSNPLPHVSEMDLSGYDREYAPREQRDRARAQHVRQWPRLVDNALESLDRVPAPVARSLMGAVEGVGADVPAYLPAHERETALAAHARLVDHVRKAAEEGPAEATLGADRLSRLMGTPEAARVDLSVLARRAARTARPGARPHGGHPRAHRPRPLCRPGAGGGPSLDPPGSRLHRRTPPGARRHRGVPGRELPRVPTLGHRDDGGRRTLGGRRPVVLLHPPAAALLDPAGERRLARDVQPHHLARGQRARGRAGTLLALAVHAGPGAPRACRAALDDLRGGVGALRRGNAPGGRFRGLCGRARDR